MASQEAEKLMRFIDSSTAFPWIVHDQYGDPHILAFSKLNPWNLELVRNAVPTYSDAFKYIDGKDIFELSTFMVNPSRDPTYSGFNLSKLYIETILNHTSLYYPDVHLIAVVQVKNDKAYEYFTNIGGTELFRFSYEHTLAEGVKGKKVLFLLN